MNFAPEKFFIGLMDFFTILLPGAMLTYFVHDRLGSALLGDDRYDRIAGTEASILLLFSSYLLGHFIFLLGARLDDMLFKPLRRGTYASQVEKLADGKKLSPRWVRAVAPRLFKKSDAPLRKATELKKQYLGPIRASSAINTYQWSKAMLTLEDPAAMTVVQRFEASSKFFRSLVVVLTILIVMAAYQRRSSVVILGTVGILLALSSYIDLRMKSINHAFWYVITIEAKKGEAALKTADEESGSMTHAGGVVYRRRLGGPEYLLVHTSKAPHKWVLPKGHVEPGERLRETAVREVHEESGIWARVGSKLQPISFTTGKKAVTAQFYLMESLEEGEPKESREHDWFSFERAVAATEHPESKELLTEANTIIRTRLS
jgi:ADP-ribose pyrophosphatase YjhB (NUDIX family)